MTSFGRRSPKGAPALRLSAILTGAIPTHPAVQDNLGSLPGWQMLGNDRVGDCVAVTWANFRRLVTAELAGKENYPSQEQVWALYKTQNPNFDPNGTTNGPGSSADGGMDIQTALEYLVQVGGPDGVKALAFAKVDHTNLEEVKAALSIFGGIWTGVNVLAANQEQFAAGHAWDYVPNSPVEGGHSVLSGGYMGPSSSDVTFITWGAETGFTDAFWANQVEEAWVVIWPEHLGTAGFAVGVNLAALATAYGEITGSTFPVPVPTAAPLPVPTPVPVANPVVPDPVPVPAPVPTPTPAAEPFPLDVEPTVPVQIPVPSPIPAPVSSNALFPMGAVGPWLDARSFTRRERDAKAAVSNCLGFARLPQGAHAEPAAVSPLLKGIIVIVALLAAVLGSVLLGNAAPIQVKSASATTQPTLTVTPVGEVARFCPPHRPIHHPGPTPTPTGTPVASPSPTSTPVVPPIIPLVGALPSVTSNLSVGTYTFRDFGITRGVIKGAGAGKTVLEMVSHTSTKAAQVPGNGNNQGGLANPTNPLWLIRGLTSVDGVTIQGTPQGHLYNGLSFSGVTSPSLTNTTITSIPGNSNANPGETFAVGFNHISGTAVVKNVTVNGGTGALASAAGLGINNSSAVWDIRNLTGSGLTYSAPIALWQVTGTLNIRNFTTVNVPRSLGAERVAAKVNLYDPSWGVPKSGHDITYTWDGGYSNGGINFFYSSASKVPNRKIVILTNKAAGITSSVHVYIAGVLQNTSSYVTFQ